MEFHTCTLVLSDTKKDIRTGKYIPNYYKNTSSIENLIIYVLQVNTGGAKYVGGRNIRYGTARQIEKDIKQIQKLYGKDNGRRMYHYILSFQASPTEENAKKLSFIAEHIIDTYFKGTQIIYGVHTNTDNLHVHFAFSAVLLNGYKWNCRRKDFCKLKKAIELDVYITMNKDNYEYRNGKWHQKCNLEELL